MARAELVCDRLKQCGIEYLIWLPDSETRYLYDAISTSGLRLVQVCHEEEAMGVYAGLYIGGKSAAVMIQNTGFFHSLDAFRGMILNAQVPMLLMIGYRGYHEMAAGKQPFDSAAVFLEPVLDTLGIKHYLLDDDEDAENIARAYRETTITSRPVAVLIGREYQ